MVVVAEVLVEVVDDRRVAPPRDRDEEVVHEPERGDRGRSAQQRPGQRHELLAAKHERSSEEVRTDRDEVVLQSEPDRRAVGCSSKPVLREDRVDADEQAEGQREDVGRMNAEGKPARTQGVEGHPAEGDGQQDLLPGLEGGQSAPSYSGPVEGGQDRVVGGQTDDPEVEGQ